MKPIRQFKAILLSFFVTLVNQSAALAAKGGSGPGGGYKYEYTTYAHLKRTQHQLQASIEAMNQSVLSAIAAPYTSVSIEKKQLIDYLFSIDFNETDDGRRPDERRIRDMHYTTENGGRIIALGPFFEEFHKEVLDFNDTRKLRRKLLQEISHLFKIGVDDNDNSVSFSIRLEAALSKVRLECGGSGSIEERISDCGPGSSDMNEEKFGKVIMAYHNNDMGFESKYNPSPLILIHDARSKFNYFLAQVHHGSVLKNKTGQIWTAEDMCSQINTLDEQISWRAITADELDQIDPFQKDIKPSAFFAPIAKSQYREITERNSGWVFSSSYFQSKIQKLDGDNKKIAGSLATYYCFGESK